jgi:hypothetical protein
LVHSLKVPFTPLDDTVDQLDTHQANSKFFNPYTFDPTQLDYQRDVRLAVRDELPTEIDASDIAENMYQYLYMTELTWPSLFFGTLGAFEPDVSTHHGLNLLLAHHPLSMGEGSSISYVQRRTCSQKVSNRRRKVHCLQIM